MAAVPSIGRADRVSGASAPEADLTRSLYERYAAQIFRYCLHQLGSREEAEDAVQSTFLNAFRGIKRGIVPELESAWLFKIAENVCLSRRRSTWRRNRIESPADFEVVEELAPAPSRLADELVGLQDVLEQMPESQRRAILLREWQGLSYREIAAELELSQTAVETLIFRARRSLAKGLAEPPAPAEKRRMVRGADLGNVLTGLKSILFGGAAAAAKTAAVVAIVGAGTVAVAPPAQHHTRSHAPASPPAGSLPLPARASVRPAPALEPRPARPFVSKAAAGSARRPTIAEPPAAPAEAAAPSASADDPAPPPASPAAAQAPPAPAPPAPNDQGKGQSQVRGSAGQGKGQGQGNAGRGTAGRQAASGGEGQGNPAAQSGQGQGSSGSQGQSSGGSSSGDSTPPPPGDSSSGGNGGNGQGNGQGDGDGHAGGAGHGH